jgi:hypothetical protein
MKRAKMMNRFCSFLTLRFKSLSKRFFSDEQLSDEIELLHSEIRVLKLELDSRMDRGFSAVIKRQQFQYDQHKTEMEMVLRGVIDAMEKIAKDVQESKKPKRKLTEPKKKRKAS